MLPEEHLKSRRLGLALIIAISMIIISGARVYYSQEQERLKTSKAEALEAVAQLKSRQISGWYLDEVHDAKIIAQNNSLVDQVESFQRNPDDENTHRLRLILNDIAQEHDYQYVTFIDSAENLVSSGYEDYLNFDGVLNNSLKESIKNHSVLSTGLYEPKNHSNIHIDFISPVYSADSIRMGTLILHINPYNQFYPLVQTWPTPSSSSETMLLIREKDSIRFVNELRHLKNTALKLTLPVSDTNYTAVKAVSGYTGIVEGVDYRNIPVLSFVDSIPGTPWYMVSETDKSEIFEGLKRKGTWIIVFVILLILLAGFGISYIFASRQRNLYKLLFHTREEFRATLYSIGDGVITTDTEGNILHMNPVAELLTGWKEADSIGKALEAIFRVIDEFSRRDAENPIDKVLMEGKIVGIAKNTILISRGGNEIPVAISGAPILNEKSETVGVVLVFRDQTEERNAAKKLKESEQRYRLLFENHTAVKFLIDPEDGSIVNANDAAAKFYGWSINQLCNMNINEINTLPGELVSKALKDASSRKRVNFSFRHRLADGSIKDVEVFSSKVDYMDKILIHSIIHDVTDKKRAEEQLRLLKKSVDQSPVNIIITDAKGIIEYVNSGFTKMTGYSREEALGRNPNFLSSGLVSEEVYAKLWKTIKSGKDWGGEFINIRKNGEKYWESAIITPVLNEEKVITHFIGIKEDVTNSKIMFKELLEAKEKAEESERLKSAFLANMSHEIRTPLNGILGFTNLLTSGEELSQEKKLQYNDIINKSAEGLLQIINDILDISRLDARQMEIERSNFDVNNTLSRLFNIFSLKLENLDKPSVRLELLSPGSSFFITSDEKRLAQVLTNLLDNALKFTRKGKIEFGISSTRDKHVEFIVKDTGIGISPEKHKVIFERFRQADDSIAVNYGGSGLGLTIVKQLVGLMGGKIIVESELGIGTTFRIQLPRE